MKSMKSSINGSSRGIRLSRLPANLRAKVEDYDNNNDGHIGSSELVMVVNDLQDTKRHNNILRTLVLGLGFFAALLIACIFGASIAAARLSQNTNVDPLTGIAYVKDGSRRSGGGGGDYHHGAVLKTEDVVIYTNNMNIVGMSNNELKVLKQIILDSGNIKFEVKGYGRSDDGSQIHLIVEGGSLITWDSDGIVTATGLAEIILDSAFPDKTRSSNSSEVEEEEEEEEGQRQRQRQRRWLSSPCIDNGETGGGNAEGGSNKSRG